MKFQVYCIEDNGYERFVFETTSYDDAKKTIASSRSVFSNGYKIYEKRFVEEGRA